MLVLTRRIGEEIIIAGEIRLMVVGVKGQKVRLGITAPTTVRVARLELLVGASGGDGAGKRGNVNGEGAQGQEHSPEP